MPKAQKVWVTKLSGIFREEPLKEGHSRPWAGKFKVECGIGESYSLVGSDREKLGEPGFDILNRHLSICLQFEN